MLIFDFCNLECMASIAKGQHRRFEGSYLTIPIEKTCSSTLPELLNHWLDCIIRPLIVRFRSMKRFETAHISPIFSLNWRNKAEAILHPKKKVNRDWFRFTWMFDIISIISSKPPLQDRKPDRLDYSRRGRGVPQSSWTIHNNFIWHSAGIDMA